MSFSLDKAAMLHDAKMSLGTEDTLRLVISSTDWIGFNKTGKNIV